MWAKLIFILPFAIGIAAYETQEYLHAAGAFIAPMVEGDVIHRQAFRRFGGREAGRLTIRIVGTDTEVVAETNGADLRKLPGAFGSDTPAIPGGKSSSRARKIRCGSRCFFGSYRPALSSC